MRNVFKSQRQLSELLKDVICRIEIVENIEHRVNLVNLQTFLTQRFCFSYFVLQISRLILASRTWISAGNVQHVMSVREDGAKPRSWLQPQKPRPPRNLPTVKRPSTKQPWPNTTKQLIINLDKVVWYALISNKICWCEKHFCCLSLFNSFIILLQIGFLVKPF